MVFKKIFIEGSQSANEIQNVKQKVSGIDASFIPGVQVSARSMLVLDSFKSR